jgi:hypothetical protein
MTVLTWASSLIASMTRHLYAHCTFDKTSLQHAMLQHYKTILELPHHGPGLAIRVRMASKSKQSARTLTWSSVGSITYTVAERPAQRREVRWYYKTHIRKSDSEDRWNVSESHTHLQHCHRKNGLCQLWAPSTGNCCISCSYSKDGRVSHLSNAHSQFGTITTQFEKANNLCLGLLQKERDNWLLPISVHWYHCSGLTWKFPWWLHASEM